MTCVVAVRLIAYIQDVFVRNSVVLLNITSELQSVTCFERDLQI